MIFAPLLSISSLNLLRALFRLTYSQPVSFWNSSMTIRAIFSWP